MLIQVREGEKSQTETSQPLGETWIVLIQSDRIVTPGHTVTVRSVVTSWNLYLTLHLEWTKTKPKAGRIIPVWFSTMDISHFQCSAATPESFPKCGWPWGSGTLREKVPSDEKVCPCPQNCLEQVQVGRERESGKAHGTINSAPIPATDCSVLTPLRKQESLLSFQFSDMGKAE